jgi:hypothetical protein
MITVNCHSGGTDYQAEIEPGKNITVKATVVVGYTSSPITPKTQDFETSFNLGDKAEYDSYNLSYYGTITKISPKQVWIEDHGTTRRLKIEDFCWRNYRFNLKQTIESNSLTLQSI